MKALYSRAIRATASGVVINRPTRVTNFTVNAVDADCIVNLRDGGAVGPILWTLEADNAASSPTICFEAGLNFERNVYMEFVTGGAQSSACIAVLEP
jgi:hypothetical protein